MKVLITGFPGTGKSTIAKALQDKGYHAYDLEHMGYMHLTSRKTGEPITLPENPPRGWFDTVARSDFDPVKVKELLASDETVIICNLADNQQDYYQLFDKIFVLVLDDAGIKHHLQTRTNNDFGKHPNSLADTLEFHEAFEQGLLARGAIPVDTSRPLPEMLEDLIKQLT